MCPLIEEFTAIFECLLDLTTVIALLKIDMQFPNQLCSFFDIPPSEICSYAYNHEIILSSLITACETKNKNSVAWTRIVSFCLYAQFLLISSHKNADIRIVSILEQVKIGANACYSC